MKSGPGGRRRPRIPNEGMNGEAPRLAPAHPAAAAKSLGGAACRARRSARTGSGRRGLRLSSAGTARMRRRRRRRRSPEAARGWRCQGRARPAPAPH